MDSSVNYHFMSYRLELYTGPKTYYRPSVIINRWLNNKKVSQKILRYTERKQGQVTLHFIRTFILCIALCYDCISFITSLTSAKESIGLISILI